MKLNNIFGKALLIGFISLIAVSAASAKGRKFGLFVGINKYTNGINPLKGCVNDAIKIREALTTKFGFKAADTTMLTDADATRQAILTKLKMYQGIAAKGDIFVFHYSGHGTLFPDSYSEYKDETNMVYLEMKNEDGQMEVIYKRDKYDSAIVPVDAASRTSGKAWRNLILDDELYEIFAGFTQKGAQVVLLSDSCHSGTVARASGSNDVQRRTTPLAAVFGVRRFSDIEIEASSNVKTVKVLPPVKGLYITMTGSKDNEFSLDASDNGVPMGLFTSTLLRTINAKNGNKLTYEKLMAIVSPEVAKSAKRYENDQNPQLVSEFGNPKALIFSVPPAK